jgi:hypothetical protein
MKGTSNVEHQNKRGTTQGSSKQGVGLEAIMGEKPRRGATTHLSKSKATKKKKTYKLQTEIINLAKQSKKNLKLKKRHIKQLIFKKKNL